MIEILESVRRTIYRWVNTSATLTEDAPYNTTTIKVNSAIRFRVGDEIALHDGVNGEPGLRIAEIPDRNTIILESPIKVVTGWRVSANAMITNDIRMEKMGIADEINLTPRTRCRKIA
jgi:hypothetical protein